VEGEGIFLRYAFTLAPAPLLELGKRSERGGEASQEPLPQKYRAESPQGPMPRNDWKGCGS